MHPKESEIWMVLTSYYFEADVRQFTSHKISLWFVFFTPCLMRYSWELMKSHLP